jgi:glycosyltransferase involved in cell wall biosynthesis
MEVVFLGDCITTQQAGIHFYAKNLVHQIVRDFPRHRYRIILTDTDPEIQIEQIVVSVKKGMPGHLRWRQLTTIPAMLNKMRPELVIELAHFGPFGLAPDIRRVTVIHDLTPLSMPHFHPWPSVIMHRLLLQGILKKADFLIVNSDHTKLDLTRSFTIDPGTICVAYPQQPDFSGTTGSLPRNFPWEDHPYFLTVGTLEPRKNQITILKAFERFCLSNRNYRLVIAGGNGWKNKALSEALAHSPVKDRIVRVGYVSRPVLQQLYQNARAFVFASHYEGFGIPILEASYFSLPLILADNESLPDIFRQAAVLFAPLDVARLAELMLRVSSDGQFFQSLGINTAEAYQKYKALRSDLSPIFG